MRGRDVVTTSKKDGTANEQNADTENAMKRLRLRREVRRLSEVAGARPITEGEIAEKLRRA